MKRSVSRYSLPLILFLLVASLTALGQRTPREGRLKPRRGPLAGKECIYGGVDWYSKVAEFTAAELEDFISGKKEVPLGSYVPALIKAIKVREWSFHDQLSKEGVDRYADLMKWCLEDGKFSEDLRTCRHRAPFPVGIRLKTGKATMDYMADNLDGSWLIRPGWIL